MTNIWVTLIQNNLYSQQILSQVWYGNVPWQDRSTLYKIFHIFMLVVLAPLSAFLMFVFKIKGTTKVERQLKFDSFNQPDGISVALQNKSVIATKWLFRPSTSALFLSHPDCTTVQWKFQILCSEEGLSFHHTLIRCK